MRYKKKRFISVISFILLVTVVFSALPYRSLTLRAIDTSKEAEQSAKDKIASLQAEQKELKSKLDAAKSNEKEQQNQKDILDSLIFSTLNEIDASAALILEYKNKIEEKSREISELENKIDVKYTLMLERLRFTYEEGNASYLEMIFDAESFTDFLMTIERVGALLDFDRSLMSELQGEMSQLKEDKESLINTKKKQEETEKQLKSKKEELSKRLSESEEYIKKLQADEAALSKAYDDSKKAENELNDEIEKIMEQRRRDEERRRQQKPKQTFAPSDGQTNVQGDTPTFNGSFIWPVSSSFSRISSPYGWRTLWGKPDFHLGIDIPADYGSSVFASADGTVVRSAKHSSYGYYVLIDHGGGMSTLYAHNSQLLVSAGQKVSQGQVIARVGSTGSSSANHCHFEVRVNGKTTNPSQYVSP